MTQPDELKPCPLPACGGASRIVNSADSWIECTKCGLSTLMRSAVEPCDIIAWNTRSTPDQQAINDVKLLREIVAYYRHDAFEEQHNGEFYCLAYNGFFDSVDQALAATDRPEYKEEG